jgi:hypothetical protein
MIDQHTGQEIVSPVDTEEFDHAEQCVRTGLKPTRKTKYLRVVDLRPEYYRKVPVSKAADIEKQATRLALRFGLTGEAAEIVAMTIVQQVAEGKTLKRANRKPDGLKGISRVERLGYWLARIFEPGGKQGGCAKSKTFSDKTLGGRNQSLAAAVEWRDRENAARELVDVVAPGRGIGETALTKEDRKKIVDDLLAKYGKCFVATGTGPLAADRARRLGQSSQTLQAIRHGKSNGFHLGNNRLRCEVAGFINELTPEVQSEIRREVKARREKWMSSEDCEDAFNACLMSYASIDLSRVDDEYIQKLAACVIRTGRVRHYSDLKGRVSLDGNGDITDPRRDD